MGQSQSVDALVTQQNSLIQEIHMVSQQLSDNYTTHFLDPNFCNRLALIFNDKMLPYQKQELDDISYTLGLVVDVPQVKSKVCESIVNHYTQRLNLIAGIQSSLSYVSDRIFALTTGPRCNGNPEIFSMEECQKSGGNWEPIVVQPDESVESNQSWFAYLNKMQTQYLSSLQKLLALLNQLNRFDEDIKDEQLKTIGTEAKQIIDQMHKNAYEMYKLILTTPTRTPEENASYEEQNQIKGQEDEARLAALRSSNGLPEEAPPS